MEDPSNSPRRQSLKRTFDQISRSPPPPHPPPTAAAPAASFVSPRTASQQQPQPAWTAHFAEAVRNASSRDANLNNQQVQESAMPQRYPGDGLDTRRPAMSTTPVIDLTRSDSPEQSRSPQQLPPLRPFPGGLPPRLNREPSVIDLDTFNFDTTSDRATPPVDLTGPTPVDLEEAGDEDDDVMFISENPRPRPHLPPNARTNGTRRHYDSTSFFQRLFGRAVPENLHQHAHAALAQARRHDRRWERLEQGFLRHERVMGSMRADGRVNRSDLQPMEPRLSDPHQAQTRFRAYGPLSLDSFSGFFGLSANVRLPENIDYEAVPFSMANAQPQGPPRPTYSAPPRVPEGFTRSPKEEDILICPNCDHELSSGDGLDKQVWAIRECGHVYCGLCASTRPVGNRKAKNIPSKAERPRQEERLTFCVVEQCEAKTNGKHKMFQIYASVG